MILGLGPFLGNLMWGKLADVLTTANGIDFRLLFLAPTALAIVAALTLLVGFRPAVLEEAAEKTPG